VANTTLGGGVAADPIFISVKEAAALLGLTTWSIYKLLDAQAIRSQYHGKRRLVRLSSVREYADQLPTSPDVA
jgi:excisionase family DNA binding protein